MTSTPSAGGTGGGIPAATGAAEQIGALAKSSTAATPGGDKAFEAVSRATEQSAPGLKALPAGAPDMAPPAAMGAGGTSAASVGGAAGTAGPMGVGTGGKEGGGAGSAVKTAAPLAAIPVLGALGQLMVLMMFIKMLKGLAMAAAALVMNLINAVIAVVAAVAKSVVAVVMGAGSALASFTGGLISTAAGSVITGVTITATLATGAGGLITTMQNQQTMRADSAVTSCKPVADEALAGTEDPDPTGTVNANAQVVYSILSGFGMPDENIAGILGNWSAESGIDSTSVEGIYDEPNRIGPRKAQAEKDNFTGYGYVQYRGIGLGQWTNVRNQNLLNYAKASGLAWHSLSTQMGFMISPAEGSDAEVVKDMIANPVGSPSAAAVHFHDKWERSADTSMELRKSKAEMWMGMLGAWEADQDLADSILAQAGATLVGADAASAEQIKSECRGADGSVLLAPGGLTLAEAQGLMDIYLAEGDAFLDGRYGNSGGPGSCGNDHAMNCVSFVAYFMNKYTTFQQYAPGNGVQTVSSMGPMIGKTSTRIPTPYSVASGPTSQAAGHTFIVLGVSETEVIIGEAGYCAYRGRVRAIPIDQMVNSNWEYLDVADLMLPPGKEYKS